jgi:hypothetical protein
MAMMTRRNFLEAGVGGVGCPYELYQCGTVFKLTPPANGQTAWAHTGRRISGPTNFYSIILVDGSKVQPRPEAAAPDG